MCKYIVLINPVNCYCCPLIFLASLGCILIDLSLLILTEPEVDECSHTLLKSTGGGVRDL